MTQNDILKGTQTEDLEKFLELSDEEKIKILDSLNPHKESGIKHCAYPTKQTISKLV